MNWVDNNTAFLQGFLREINPPPKGTPEAHPAEARLARLHKTTNKTFRDVNVNSLAELVETFDQLDEAVRSGNRELVSELILKLDLRRR